MDAQPPRHPAPIVVRAGRALLSVSLVVAMVLAASLIGVGGAAIFIYRQMGNSASVSKTLPGKGKTAVFDTDAATRLEPTPAPSAEMADRHPATPTVAESTEWHFAEFSDKPRYIDVTYDGGRQHARLKVNTVLSSKPDVATQSSLVSDTTDDSTDLTTPLNDPDSHYIVDKETGRVIGIDGSAGAAKEVRRAQPVTATFPAATIRNPVPEVRVASPVLDYGRPVFDDERPVQAAIPASQFLPTRKALPVEPGDLSEPPAPNSTDGVVDGSLPVRRTRPVSGDLSSRQYEQIFESPVNTSVFGRKRSAN